jgi:hypothetical protein
VWVFSCLLVFALAGSGSLVVSSPSAGAGADESLGGGGWSELVGLFENDGLRVRLRLGGMTAKLES